MASQESDNETDAVIPRPSAIATSDTIIVEVGEQAKRYILHQELLCFHSGYFRGALSGNFKETTDGIVPLKDVEITAFDIFVDWMYGNVLPLGMVFDHRDAEKDPRGNGSKAYVAADMLIVPRLKKDLFQAYHHELTHAYGIPSLSLTVWLFRKLPENDPVLHLVVDGYCYRHTRWGLSSKDIMMAPDLPKDFLVRVFLRLNALNNSANRGVFPNINHYKLN